MPRRANISIKSAARERSLIALANRQQAQVTRGQLLTLGFSDSSIRSRCRHGRLFRGPDGVYSVGRPASTALERASAAVLACGLGAALSHGGALSLWGFDRRWHEPFHVTVPGDRRRPGIVIHRAPGLARADVRRHLGIGVTSPARTLLDCAPDLPPRRLARFVADGRREGKLGLSALADVAVRFPYHTQDGARYYRCSLPPGHLHALSSRTCSWLSARATGCPGPRSTRECAGMRWTPFSPPRA